MNYDSELQRLITAIKADKNLSKPWKNYAMSDLARVQAVVRMAATTTYQTPPEGRENGREMRQDEGLSVGQDACICPPGGKHKDCPIHGWPQ